MRTIGVVTKGKKSVVVDKNPKGAKSKMRIDGYSGQPIDKPKLDKMKKDQLKEYADEHGVDYAEESTVEDLKSAIVDSDEYLGD